MPQTKSRFTGNGDVVFNKPARAGFCIRINFAHDILFSGISAATHYFKCRDMILNSRYISLWTIANESAGRVGIDSHLRDSRNGNTYETARLAD
jgi:hypothetical protein